MFMIYDRFPVFFALSITCLSLAIGHSSSLTERRKNYSLIVPVAVAETTEKTSLIEPSTSSAENGFQDGEIGLDDRSSAEQASVDNSTLTAEALKYKNYMQAGYQANQDQDYLTALQYFKTALAVRPEDSFAKKAIHNVTSYAFDSYMQAGYLADKQREYQVALQHFQQAQKIRPDSFHAQQAVRNINNYLAVANSTESESQPSDQSNNSFWLMLLALVGTTSLAGVILFFLFQKSYSESSEQSASSLSADNEVETVVTPTKTYPEVTTQSSSAHETTVVATTSRNGQVEERENTRLITNEGNSSHSSHQFSVIEQQSARDSSFVSSSPSNVSKLDIIPELIQNLEQSDRALRRKTIWELAQRSDSRAMKPLVELMIKVDSQERSLILEAMTQIASRTLKPMNQALTLSLEDNNSQVRQNAIRDLTRVYELMSQVTQRLSVAVEDSDEEVQETAKWALKQLNQMPKVNWQNPTNSSDAS